MKTMLGLSYSQLFEGVIMSYLRYLRLFEDSGFQHIFCCVLLSSCVPYATSFSGLSIFDCPFGIL